MPQLPFCEEFTYIVLACGWGGVSCGAQQAGANYRGGIDICENSIANHKLNFPGTPIMKWDLNKVSVKKILKKFGKVKVVVITAECQGISIAGVFDPFDFRNSLLIRCIRLAAALSPDIILIENVAGIKMGRMREFYDIVKFELSTLFDYTFTDKILNSLHYHTPQSRRRWFAMGTHNRLGVLPSFPEPDKTFAEFLRIKNIDTGVEYMKSGYHNPEGLREQTIRYNGDFCYTITKMPNVWTQDDVLLSKEQVLKYCGYPPTWLTTGSDLQIWNRAGNSVMPPMTYHLMKHIREQILGL